MSTSKPTAVLYGTGNYAVGVRAKLRRALELGPKYYLIDVPRYWWQRRSLGLPMADLGALYNPVRSMRGEIYMGLPLPPRYDEALERLASAGVQFDNPRGRTEALVGLWWDVRSTAGDVIECGAYRGATSLLLATLGALHDVDQRVLVLDTFAGMPAPSSFDLARKPGEFAPPLGWTDVIARQAEALGVSDRLELHAGLFAETFPAIVARNPRFAFAHIDANIYAGTRDACAHAIPHMVPGGAVVFDDYNGLMDLGARLAIDAYLAQRGLTPKPLAECSAFLRT